MSKLKLFVIIFLGLMVGSALIVPISALINQKNTIVYVVQTPTTSNYVPDQPAEISEETPVNPVDIEPKEIPVKQAEDVAIYFNEKSIYGEAEFIDDDNFTGWYLGHNFGPSTDDSSQGLREAISYFRRFLPLKSVVEGGYLMQFGGSYAAKTLDCPAYCVSIDTSSNCFAAVSVFSYLEDEELIVEIYIYDGRAGLYNSLA